MADLEPGLYETLVTEGLQLRIAELDELAQVRRLRSDEAPDRIALHLSRQIEQALAEVGDADRVRIGVEVARALIERLTELVPSTGTASLPRHASDRRQPARVHAAAATAVYSHGVGGCGQ